MTAFVLNKQATAVSTSSSSIRPSTSFRVLNQKRRATNASCDGNVQQRTAVSSEKKMSPVLISLRRNYVSRGLRSNKTISLAAEKKNFCDIDRSCPTSDVPITRPSKSLERDPTHKHYRIKGARRSVSLLKFASQQQQQQEEDYDEMENDDTDDESLSSSVINSKTSNDDDSRYTIKFQCYVKVVEIPNRYSYSTKQKKRIWNDCKSIRTNAKRNRIEYEWEKSSTSKSILWWQHAPEEQDFCTSLTNNDIKVHPVYLPEV